MATRRSQPYVWASWITKLMAGESQCTWAAWFRAHHRYDKLPRGADLSTWTANHGELVDQCSASLQEDGYDVRREDQNRFRLRGRSGAVLAGKPDIVATNGAHVRVIDCKTGTPRNSDQLQVKLYMYVLPLAQRTYIGKALQGEVVYRANVVIVPARSAGEDFKRLLAKVLEPITANEEPEWVPSASECGFCDISSRDCPARIDETPLKAQVDFF